MERLINFIDEINANNSQNFKIEKLKEILVEDKYKDFIKFIYDDNNFYVSENTLSYNETEEIKENKFNSLSDLKDFLNILNRRELSFKQIEEIYRYNMSQSVKSLFLKCLNHNLFTSVSNKVIEKAWKEMSFKEPFFKSYPYMRCSLMDKLKHISYPAFSQIKMDGSYANIIVKKNSDSKSNSFEVEIYSRQGKRMEFGPILYKRLYDYFFKLFQNNEYDKNKTFVFMGESLILDENNKPLDRKTGNGLITSLYKRMSTLNTIEQKLEKKETKKLKEELNQRIEEFNKIEETISFTLWDYMDYEEWQCKKEPPLYKERLNRLNDILSKNESKLFNLIYTKEVNNYDEAYNHFVEVRKVDGEGTILKNKNLSWKNGTSNEMIKFKSVKECELKVVGFEFGSGKYVNGIGSLLCESCDGLVKVAISGLTESMRGLERVDINDASKGLKIIDNFNFNQYTGKIITVEFNELIKAKDKEDYSLFLPRIKEIRYDKDEADSLEYIKNLNGFKC